MKKILLLTITLLATARFVVAAEAINVDQNGLGLQGYDPVGYFTDNKPIKGDPKFTATYLGATYQFASEAHQKTFESAPAKYAPQFGGFCGYAASINKLAPIEVEFFQVLHGRLVMQHNEKAWKLWHEDVEGNLKKADANWPKLSQQKPPAPEAPAK
jgi:YHS domain-containing protein